MDFLLNNINDLIFSLLRVNYNLITFSNYSSKYSKIEKKIIILRHDVDIKPGNSLKTAFVEHSLGIRGTYFFRIVKESFDVDIIKQIADLGHEIGYHYETMDTASSRFKSQNSKLNDKQKEQLIDAAYEEFCENLEVFRKIYPVKTICMHGSPKSAFDNREIWKKYDYRQLGIIGEPYFDIDFDKFFYLTDTGRCWNGYKYSVRDKMPQQEQWIKQGLVFKTTNDIIKAVEENRFPDKVMITIHPQRWTNNYLEWTKEIVAQRAKNIIKWGLMRYRAAFRL